jgi:hypothetical protein
MRQGDDDWSESATNHVAWPSLLQRSEEVSHHLKCGTQSSMQSF